MAPEHLQDVPCSASDQYSLAVMVCQWLTGKKGVSFACEPNFLRQFVQDLPLQVEEVVRKALAEDPRGRFETALAFAYAFKQVANPADPNQTDAAWLSEHPVRPIPTPPPSSLPWRKVSWQRVMLLVILILLLLGGGLGSVALHSYASYQRQIQATATARATAEQQQCATAYNKAAHTDGIMFGFNAQHSHMNPYECILNVNTVAHLIQKWKFPTGGAIYSSPTVVDGVVYIGSEDHRLDAIDAHTGRLKWSFVTGDVIENSSPAVANGIVYIGSFDGNLYAIDVRNGHQLWKFLTGGRIFDSPVVVDGVVYIASTDDYLYALDAKTGTLVWAFLAQTGIYDGSPTVTNGLIYVGDNHGNFYAIDLKTGKQRWVYVVPDTVGYHFNIYSSPVAANGMVYFGATDNKLYALESQTGKVLWSSIIRDPLYSGSIESLAVADGRVSIISYSDLSNSVVYTFDAQTGAQDWFFRLPGHHGSGPTIANHLAYIGSGDQKLYAFDAATGAILWVSPPTGSMISRSSPAIVNGIVYVGSLDGSVYAFGLP